MKPDSSLSELRLALLGFKSVWRSVIVISLIIGLLGFTSTVYMLEVYDRVVTSRSVTTLLMLTVVAFGAYAVMEVLEKIRSRMLWSVGIQFELKLVDRVYNAMFDGLLKKQMGGALTVQNDLRTVREFFNNPALSAVFEVPMALVAVVLIFFINPLLGWAAFVGALMQTFVAWLLQRASRKPLLEAQRRSQEAQIYAEASLRNTQVMESMGMMPAVMAQWQKKQQAFLAFQARASESAGGLNAVSKLLQQLMGSVMLGLAAWMLLEHSLNGGSSMMIISSVLAGRLLTPLTQVVQQWSALVSVTASWTRLEQLLALVPARASNMALPAPKGELIVEALTAAPPGQAQPVLRGVQFGLPPGCVLGVIGPSASGKTSLARLLMGIWVPMAGKVRLDGADVHIWDKEELGPYLGYLPQGVELMEGTLAENIARFGDVDMGRVQDAARLVGLHEFILSLPDGYETAVGRDGGLLSGGQRQRVALARALFGNPVLVVLDEPNSSLDEAGDAALSQAIQVMKSRGTTFVVITHRTSVLSVTDRLLLLRDGTQQMYGPTAEVMQKLMPAQVPTQAAPVVAQGA
ncbi:type I secretion system permease/ATPase [Limnohabitans radicicola]|uniref:Type I secretion system permease/ATPase n=1 Tax=Limnohabitans radicicola TaxID=2771427 RepID=A0A927IIJ5_9BURK|nr:type I secretion system permease/ATPase [Limnohabitans radicicola]MBD8049684.1 type I secretion system permease/ATPase [Limnohabitans radicicola]